MSDKTIWVYFFETGGLASSLIRFFTFSQWNHVGIKIGDKFYHSNYKNGVHCISDGDPNTQVKGSVSNFDVIPIRLTNEQYEKMDKFLSDQCGKKYDLTALFAFPFRKNWSDDKEWFCSELVAAVLHRVGIISTPKAYRITPKDLYLILKTLQHVINKNK